MTGRPRILLIGDSIAVGYAPLVAERLAESATVLAPPENAGDSANLLAHLGAWILAAPPDLLHFNCGLHDLRRLKPDGRFQQPLEAYRRNLRQVTRRLADALPGRLIWATITAVIDERQRPEAAFQRREADVRAYNVAALEIVRGAGIPVSDLHGALDPNDLDRLMAADGVHMTDAGYEALAGAVSAALKEALAR